MNPSLTEHVRAALADVLARPVPDQDLDVELDVLGLDSLDRVELAVRLEARLDRPVPDAVIYTARTGADLIELVEKSMR